jgi:hypothetical protein
LAYTCVVFRFVCPSNLLITSIGIPKFIDTVAKVCLAT